MVTFCFSCSQPDLRVFLPLVSVVASVINIGSLHIFHEGSEIKLIAFIVIDAFSSLRVILFNALRFWRSLRKIWLERESKARPLWSTLSINREIRIYEFADLDLMTENFPWIFTDGSLVKYKYWHNWACCFGPKAFTNATISAIKLFTDLCLCFIISLGSCAVVEFM